MELRKTEGEIDSEVSACLALAKAFDTADLTCPPHSHEKPSYAEETNSIEFDDLSDTEKLARISAKISQMCRTESLNDADEPNERTHKAYLYLLACNAYRLAKNIHKESFFLKESSVSTESCETSLTK